VLSGAGSKKLRRFARDILDRFPIPNAQCPNCSSTSFCDTYGLEGQDCPFCQKGNFEPPSSSILAFRLPFGLQRGDGGLQDGSRGWHSTCSVSAFGVP
jgi:hypothetical protein